MSELLMAPQEFPGAHGAPYGDVALPDKRQVAASFSRAAASYDSVAELQRSVGNQLLAYLPASLQPLRWLDLGSGTGHAAAAMKKRWPKSQVLVLDLSLPMLRQSRRQAGWWRPFTRLCADARALPLADGRVDLVFANL